MRNIKFSFKTFTLRHIVFIGIICIICGCAATAAYTKFYEGPERPLSEIAILTEPNPYLRELLITKINNWDGIAGFTELLPGLHKITAIYQTSTGGYNRKIGTAFVEFQAKGGHVYEIYPVLHTHDNGWYIGIWDVTDELNRPEKKELSQKIDVILKKNRINPTSISAENKGKSDKAIGKLPGFGEKMKAEITGMKGKPVDIEYTFNRYKPHLLVKGSDEREYHIKISQINGSVENVLGIKVSVGDFIKGSYGAFQPLNSDRAYLYDFKSKKVGAVTQIWKEMPDGSYTRIK